MKIDSPGASSVGVVVSCDVSECNLNTQTRETDTRPPRGVRASDWDVTYNSFTPTTPSLLQLLHSASTPGPDLYRNFRINF